MNVLIRSSCVAIVAAALSCAAVDARCGDVLGGFGSDLSPWAPHPGIQPIHPIRPIHPIYPWNPWYGNRIVFGPTYGVPNYYYPPGRWDPNQWDGRNRNPQPQPERKPPPPPERPKIIQWNAATGSADVRDLDRWDDAVKTTPQSDPATQPPASQPAATPSNTDSTKDLQRWDAP